MKNIPKTKRDSLIAAGVFYVLLSGYCLLAGLSLFIPFLLLFYSVHLILFKDADGKRLLDLALLLALIVFTASTMTEYSRFSPFYIPVACVPMLTMLLLTAFSSPFPYP